MNSESTLAGLQAENKELRKALQERNKDLLQALSALSSMWNQYCPSPRTHMCMSAGEEAEEILRKWRLMLEDDTSIYIDGMLVNDDILHMALDLVGIPPLPGSEVK
jgi:hypothetical protein